jgi:glucosamine-6-phosphate deaminase
MDVLRTSHEGQAESLTAGIIAEALRTKPDLVLGLATGRTMKHVYAHLARLHREDGLDFSPCRTFNLDEYIGIPADHSASYRRYMEEHLCRHVNIQAEHAHVPDGMTSDVEGECRKYEVLVKEAGGIDLQLLGLGRAGLGTSDSTSLAHPSTRAPTGSGSRTSLEIRMRVLSVGSLGCPGHGHHHRS